MMMQMHYSTEKQNIQPVSKNKQMPYSGGTQYVLHLNHNDYTYSKHSVLCQASQRYPEFRPPTGPAT